MKYIDDTLRKPETGCIFCTRYNRQSDKEDLILWRGKHCFVIMNLYPYNNGHLMVVPYKHSSDIAALDKEESVELWQTIVLCRDALTATMNPDGMNIGMNLGRTAGAGVEDHVHMHIVPRWNGDTNFMPVIGETKVISQSLEAAWELLRAEFDRSGK